MKLKIKIGVLLLIFFLFLLFMDLYVISVILILILTILYYLNKHVKRKITSFRRRMCIDFMNDNRRNFDIIKIGTPFILDPEYSGKQILDLTSNNQSITSSYLFLIHNYSYLAENRETKILLNPNNRNKKINIYELFCFHPVVQRQLCGKILYIIQLFPLSFEVFSLCGMINGRYNLAQLEDFCKNRNINFRTIN